MALLLSCVFILFISLTSNSIIEKSLALRNSNDNITEALNSLINNGYDKRVRPNYGGKPVDIGITMYIINVDYVSETQMDFKADFYFRQMWRDERLAFKLSSGVSYLVLDGDMMDRVWLPDTFFANEKTATFHTETKLNRFLRLSSNGDILYSRRISATFRCPMDLRYFPTDRQICGIEMESYGYSMNDINYNFIKSGVSIADDLTIIDFKVVGIKNLKKVETLSTGNYSRLVSEIEFVRSAGYYLKFYYIPAALIVIISWIQFWVHIRHSTVRALVGLTANALMLLLLMSAQKHLPKVSIITGFESYLYLCFSLTILSLLEFATALHYTPTGKESGELFSPKDESVEWRKLNARNAMAYMKHAGIDVWAKIAFPLAFILINIIHYSHCFK